MPELITRRGERRQIKSEDWLLKNFHLVREFEVRMYAPAPGNDMREQGRMRAELIAGGYFEMEFTGLEYLLGWLDRPKFRMMRLSICNGIKSVQLTIGLVYYQKVKETKNGLLRKMLDL